MIELDNSQSPLILDGLGQTAKPLNLIVLGAAEALRKGLAQRMDIGTASDNHTNRPRPAGKKVNICLRYIATGFTSADGHRRQDNAIAHGLTIFKSKFILNLCIHLATSFPR